MARQGATLYLLVHTVTKGPESRTLRAFSISEDFEPGGTLVYFPQLDEHARAAIEQAWLQLDGANNPNHDPLNARLSLYKLFKLPPAGGWDNYLLIFECAGRRRPLPGHPRAPLMLCHLNKDTNTNAIYLKHTLTVSPSCKVGDVVTSYDFLDGNWRKAIKEQLMLVNSFEMDMTKHPWALKRMFHRVVPGKYIQMTELTLVLEWQDCEPMEPTLNLRPVLSISDRSSVHTNVEDGTALPAYTPR